MVVGVELKHSQAGRLDAMAIANHIASVGDVVGTFFYC